MAARRQQEREEASIIVLNIGGQPVGLLIDNFSEGINTIVKPMEGVMANFKIYTGTALLGDRSVASGGGGLALEVSVR